ncbi:MAG: xylose isomerase, partial [Armatimonadota bacterium]
EMVADLIDTEGITSVRERFDRAGIRPACFGLPVDWRTPYYDEDEAVRKARRAAKAAAAIECRRCGTWVLPGDDDRNADQYGEFLISRLGPIAEVLHDQGIGLGLEFVGPRTLRSQFRFPGPYTLKAMLRTAGALGPGNGLLLDIFHLFTSGGTLEDLRGVDPSRILLVHLNDARSGRSMDEQVDHERDLPGATGLLDLRGFLGVLREMGYDGPVIAEPFLDSLKELPDDETRVTRVGESIANALAI